MNQGHWLFIALFVLGMYFLPSLLAHEKRNFTAILWLNILAGWTFIGWIVALIWALTKEPLGSSPQPASPPESHHLRTGILAFIAIAVVLAIVSDLTKSPDAPASSSPENKQLIGDSGACRPSQIGIAKLRAVRDSDTGYTRITGSLTNNCTSPAGPRIKITVYDKAGNILSSEDMWPASVSNIPPNTVFPFEWLDNSPYFDRFTVEVISISKW